MGRPQIGHEQGRFAIAREPFEAGQHAVTGEEGRAGGGGGGGIPVEETVVLPALAQPFEQLAGGGGERGLGGRAGFRVGEARRDGRQDLLREIEVVPRESREKGVDEMQPAKVFATGHFLGFPRLLISSMNSETSRNSLYTLAKRTYAT